MVHGKSRDQAAVLGTLADGSACASPTWARYVYRVHHYRHHYRHHYMHHCVPASHRTRPRRLFSCALSPVSCSGCSTSYAVPGTPSGSPTCRHQPLLHALVPTTCAPIAPFNQGLPAASEIQKLLQPSLALVSPVTSFFFSLSSLFFCVPFLLRRDRLFCSFEPAHPSPQFRLLPYPTRLD